MLLHPGQNAGGGPADSLEEAGERQSAADYAAWQSDAGGERILNSHLKRIPVRWEHNYGSFCIENRNI